MQYSVLCIPLFLNSVDLLIYLPEIQSARCAHVKSNKKKAELTAF